ncbi:daf-12-interacting protein 1 isoform X2 [Gouania willdenowi]|uniref:daf-12-interacting protein 1 isoform X2 n=1 Tax=Gouania willdenowi TaxID=441366 RepID=UPI0010543201|nr:daf-12-interacting protein 1-like isoform X2 [Gouania willdenowi]
MENNTPRMRRPKRKLCYLSSYENPPQPWTGALSLMDVDKMFDDMDSSPQDDLCSPSPLLTTFDVEKLPDNKVVSPISPEETGFDKDKPHPSKSSPGPTLDAHLDIPFVAHLPAKTSSPIEENIFVKSAEKLNDINSPPVTPVLFPLEEETQDKANAEPPLAHEHQSNEQVKEEKKTWQPDEPVVAQTKQPESATSDDGSKKDPKPKESSTRVVKDMTAFLQKLRKAVQSKPPPCSRKSELPVEVPAPSPPPSPPPPPPPPPPPEPEDDFLILDDDDTTFQFCIPHKSGPSRKQKQSRFSSSNKDSSSEKGSKDSLEKTPRKQEEPEKASDKLEHDNMGLGTKRKGNKKIHEDAESESCKASFVSPVDQPLDAVKTQENVKPPKKAQSKKSPKNHQTDTETEKPSEKPKTKATKSFETKKSKHIQTKEEHRKAKKSSTRTRKRQHVSEAGVKKNTCMSSEEQNDTEALAPPTETQRVDSDPDGKVKQSKPVSEQSSSDDERVFGKRRRRQTGQWWMISSHSAEETDNQVDLVKKSKVSTKNSNTAVPLLAEKNKKDKVLKKRKPKETVLPSPILNQAKGKKTKQKIKRNTKENMQEKKKKAQEVFKSVEEVEEQEVIDGMDQEQSCPSSSNHRNHNNNSEQVIQTQRVDHHSINEERVHPISPIHRKEQLYGAEPSKRRRKPTGNWWMVNDDNNVAAGVSSPLTLPHKERKPSKDKKKPSKRKTSPESNNQDTVDQSSKPAEGAPVMMKPVFTPKTVKSALVKFNDIFASGVETPSVMKSRDVPQLHGRELTTHPAVEDCEANAEMLTESQRESTSYVFRSGPTSLIELEEHEENGESVLPTTRGQAVLSVSDLCGPPLQPLSLQPKDKVNLGEMFKCLWSTLAKNDAEITPDHFDWFFHKDRAMGILEDLNDSTYCTGKLVLGSYMKKPLWVDHSATTVFHLNSSSVNVSVDARTFSYSPGQAFVVHCGCAYSIKNITAQPALLYFTRMLAESSD